MKKTFFKTIAAATAATLILLLVASESSAHDTWLFSSRTNVPVGTRLSLDLTSGMAFPRNMLAIDPARIEAAMVRLGGSTTPMTRKVISKKFLRLETTLSRPGVATLWISLKPKTLELTPAQVQEYLEEIGAPDSIRALYPAGKKGPRWREEYRKEAKSFVFVGAAENDTSWRIPAGNSLELVPVTDPRTISSGDHVAFRLLRSGKPLPNFPVGDVTEHKTAGRLSHTDANGVLHLTAPRAGRWMLRATELRRPAAGSNIDWESVFATLTLNVRSGSK